MRWLTFLLGSQPVTLIVKSFPYGSDNECYKKLPSRSWQVLIILNLFFSVQSYILEDYSSERIAVNMINKHHMLPIVYTMLVKIC